MLPQVICRYGPGAVTTADLSCHVLAAMGTPVLSLHLEQVAVCHWSHLSTHTVKKKSCFLGCYLGACGVFMFDVPFFGLSLPLCSGQAAAGRGTRSPAGPVPMSERWSPSLAPNISSTSQGMFLHVRIKFCSKCSVCVCAALFCFTALIRSPQKLAKI